MKGRGRARSHQWLLACGAAITLAATPAGSIRPDMQAPLEARAASAAAVAFARGEGRAPAAAQQAGQDAGAHRALLNKYCVSCHNGRLKTANLVLEDIDLGNLPVNAPVWEKVVVKLRSAAMPPPGRPRPDKAVADGFTAWIVDSLDRAAMAAPNPGRPLIHRLNRSEYTNAVRDLLGVAIDGRALLPVDAMSAGFDNISDVLTITPGLMERYLSAAQKISRLAVGDRAIRPVVELYRAPKNDRQEQREGENMPWGTRGGLSVRREFPVEGEYLAKVRFIRPPSGGYFIRGFHERSEIEVRLDRALMARFAIGGGETSAGTGNNNDGVMREEKQDTKYEELWLAPGVSTKHDMENEPDAVSVTFPASAGAHVVSVAFPQRTLQTEGLAPRLPTADYGYQRDANNPAALDSIELGGPFNVKSSGQDSPSRRLIFSCRPSSDRDADSCARSILGRLARRAYRGPVGDAAIQTLMRVYADERRARGFDAGIEAAIEALLSNPQFLFRAERAPAGATGIHRISDLDLASRLSFFLWSSIPDEELLRLAERGQLKDPQVLAQQVQRMMADSRSAALVDNFAGQWLYLRNLRGVVPDTHEFPDFDDELRTAFQRETELFFDAQLRGDRPIIDLLRSNETFLNERLARHYGIPNIYGSHYRRVTLLDESRFGILGKGSILTVTSYANRTSPVLRGKWVLENVIGAPPPPPPPDVPSLKEEDGPGSYQTMRERMEQHRKNPVCATCHAQIDPLGFAMESYDAVGRWRTLDGTSTIDASGTMPDGRSFDGIVGMRKRLVEREEDFVTTVTRKLLTYALGRGVEYYDMPAIRRILGDARKNDYRWSSIIMGIVTSTPFQMVKAQS